MMFSQNAILCIGFHFLILFGNSRQGDDKTTQKHWALLVAGSKDYINYRHQADVCHAYHVVRKHGIPPENIVVMMYDDIAFNADNPYPGNIINEPDGPNLYSFVQKDYTGDEVNPAVFLSVLSGNASGVETLIGREGKVINSGPNDTVFLYFADHGSPGMLLFPNKELGSWDFVAVLDKMHTNKQYKHMVIYVEACFSGSVFRKPLRDNLGIYVTTAANSDESSRACYYDQKRKTFLGDVYSVKWMENSEVYDLKKETLQGQFELVKNETKTSHVMQYGDVSLASLSVGDFQGNLTDNNLYYRPSKKHHDPNIGAVPSEDVAFEILTRRKDHEGMKKLMEWRDSTRQFFQDVVISLTVLDFWTLHNKPVIFSDFECYKESIAQIKQSCPGMNLVQNDYALQSLRVLANLCETDIEAENIWMKIQTVAEITPLCFSNFTD